jgi:2,4-dienoyl-CoA reductase-like NADH-dependent reductase (Old Yellow Enzyme family)
MKFGRQRRHDRIANRSALERDAHGNLSQFNRLDSCGHVRNQEEAIVEKGDVDLVAFGRHFLGGFVKRIKLGLPLNDYDRKTFYTFDFHG